MYIHTNRKKPNIVIIISAISFKWSLSLSQIEFILDVLSRMPKPLIRRINKREYTQTWGKGPFDTFWKWLSGSYWKQELVIPLMLEK